MSRLPTVSGDSNAWGTVLNDYLSQSHFSDGLPMKDIAFVNVKDTAYGATGDGGTDDTTAVQNAIAAAASTGGTVFFPHGNYIVSGLTIPPQVNLQGVNGRSYLTNPQTPISRITLKPASTAPLIQPDDSGTPDGVGVRIADLMLDTNGIARQAIYLPDMGASSPRFWTIERCLIVNSGYSSGTQGYHVYVGNLNTGCTIRDCQLLSNSTGVTTQGANGWNGIGWYGQDGLLENTFVGCYGNAGISSLGGSSEIPFTVRGGGTFWNLTGIIIAGTGTIVDGLSVDHNYNDGAYIGYGCVFTNCVFHTNSLQTNNQWSHIRIGTAARVSVSDCRHAPQSPDAPANVAAYFLSATSGSVVSEVGNFQHPSATLGTAWSDIPTIGGTPTGAVFEYTGATAPFGYLFCDGSSLLRSDYPALFTALGGASSEWGLPDGTHFNVPDFRGRMPVGVGTHADVSTLAANDGVAVASRRPKHQHSIKASGQAGASNDSVSAGLGDGGGSNALTSLASSPSDTSPYLVVNFIIKT